MKILDAVSISEIVALDDEDSAIARHQLEGEDVARRYDGEGWTLEAAVVRSLLGAQRAERAERIRNPPRLRLMERFPGLF